MGLGAPGETGTQQKLSRLAGLTEAALGQMQPPP